MTMPNSAEGLAEFGLEWAIQGTGQIPGMLFRTQAAITATLKAQIQASEGWLFAHISAYAGLPAGVPLVPAIFIRIVSTLTGIPMEDLVDVWDITADQLAFIENLFISLATTVQNILTSASPLDALKLIGQIRPSNLGLIPLNAIVDFQAEQLINGTFDTIASVDTAGGWTWDGTTGRLAFGSAHAVGNVTDHILESNRVQAFNGQVMNLGGWFFYQNLAYNPATSPMQVVATAYDDAGAFMSDTVIASIAPNSDDSEDHPDATISGWIPCSANFTVPTGCDWVSMKLVLTDDALLGDVWFDDASVHRTGTPSWLEYVVGIGDSIIDTVVSVINGAISVGNGIPELEGAVTYLTGNVTAAGDIAHEALDQLADLIDTVLGPGSTVAELGEFISDTATDASTALAGALSAVADAAAALANWPILLSNAEQSTVATLGLVIKAIVSGWQTALNLLNMANPSQLVQALRGLFPGVTPTAAGIAFPTDPAAFVNNLNGTIGYVRDQATAGFSNLIQQADGTWITAAKQLEMQAAAAVAAGSANIAAATTAGQQMIDQGIAAIQAAGVQAGASAADFGAHLSGVFTSLYNSWAGAATPQAGADLVAEQAAIQAAAAAAQAALTEEISSQLPNFYGSSGAGGLSASQNFTGLTTLPAGFTQVTCPLCASTAKYNTIGTQDDQTVSGIWSATDYLPKYLILRASADFSYLVYAKVQTNSPAGAAMTEIGCLVGGVKTVFGTTVLPGGGARQANQAYKLTASGYNFTLTGPSGLIYLVTDSLHVSQLGALYRYGGFGTDGDASATTPMLSSGNFNVPGGFTTGDKFDTVGYSGAGGGGGQNTGSFWDGHGGNPGAAPFAATLTYGVDIPLTTTAFVASIGAGGAAGANNNTTPSAGSPGGATTLTIAGYGVLSAAGGTGGAAGTGFASDSPGHGASNVSWNNAGYTGGAGAPGNGSPAPGSQPGGGGGGGSVGLAGSSGGAGEVFVTPISIKLPGTMLSWVFYDSGPLSGPATGYNAAIVTNPNIAEPNGWYTYTNDTDECSVVIGDSGMALVGIGAYITYTGGAADLFATFKCTGANTIPPETNFQNGHAIGGFIGSANYRYTIGEMQLMTGLNPGTTLFKMAYGSATLAYRRRISVIPL